MLSILIPIYNFSCADLVAELHRQAAACAVPFEIILMDDASTLYKEENRKLSQLPGVKLIELPENIGRAKIRNRLAGEAKFDSLLFMDVDVRPTNENYVKNYLEVCADYPMICGGLAYCEKPPQDKKRYLHWLVGTNREVISVEKRRKKPNKSFLTSNFLIHKNIFNQIRFDENISKYGHEDTLFGFELKKRGITIHHIDNPLEHIGLETSERIIAKEKEGIENLYFVILKHNHATEITEDITLLKYYRLLRKLHAAPVSAYLYRKFHEKIEQNLTSEKPSLLLFDFYKLGYLCQLKD